MTKKEALSYVLSRLDRDANPEAYDTVSQMYAQLTKPRTNSEEAKEKRRNATAAARAELVAKIAPVLREGLSHTLIGVTAKELYFLCQSNLPEDFSAAKVQNILLREMAPELEKVEEKGKPNLYRLLETA